MIDLVIFKKQKKCEDIMKKIDKILFYSLICFILMIVDCASLAVFAQQQIFSPIGIEGI
ncbi:MAG: hypothetical protein MUP69_01880 [Candidatus Atribacteria bacterium]|nr:hypothetical protein [Candidatus Atribacteria bacterium]